LPRIEDALHFIQVAGLRLHHHADPFQLEVRQPAVPAFQTRNSGFDDAFGFARVRTSMDTTPAAWPDNHFRREKRPSAKHR